jgi:hypothetical protein
MRASLHVGHTAAGRYENSRLHALYPRILQQTMRGGTTPRRRHLLPHRGYQRIDVATAALRGDALEVL